MDLQWSIFVQFLGIINLITDNMDLENLQRWKNHRNTILESVFF